MQIIEDVQMDYSDVLIKPRRSTIVSRKDADITRDYKYKTPNGIRSIRGTGIMQANMGTIGNFEVSKILLEKGLFACLHKHHSIDNLVEFYSSLPSEWFERCFISIGLRDKLDGYNKLDAIIKECGVCPPICIDVPNGYIPQVKQLVIDARNRYEDAFIMVGNVVTGDITEDLILSGANAVKVGIGGGCQCLTRKQTGCGRPQLSAVIECADAAHQVGGMVCADGGITCPGDIGKAFGGGADFVMIGGLFAGTDEAEGEVITKYFSTNNEYTLKGYFSSEYSLKSVPVLETKKFKKFYGMSSTLAQETFGNGKPNYRASEGRVSLVPYVGSVSDVVDEMLGGLRSTMTYLGATKLKDIPKCCTFYKVNHQLNTMFENTTIGK